MKQDLKRHTFPRLHQLNCQSGAVRAAFGSAPVAPALCLSALCLAAAHYCSPARAQSGVQTPALLAAQSVELKSVRPPTLPAGEPYDPVGAAFTGLNLDPNKWKQGERDAIELGSRLREARSQRDAVQADYGGYVRGAGFVVRTVEASSLLSPVLGPWGVAGAAGLKVAADMNAVWRQREFDAVVVRTQKQYAAQIDEGATLIIGRAQFKRQSDESEADAARRYVAEFMNTNAFLSMDDESRAAVREQLRQRVDQKVAADEKVTRQRLDALEANKDAIQKVVSETQKDLSKLEGDVVKRLQATLRATEVTLAGLQAFEKSTNAQLSKLQSDVTELQYMSWSQLPPGQKLKMLDNPGFLPNLPDREGLKKKLEMTQFAQDAGQYLTAVGDAAALLDGLGIPINLASVNQGVNLATNGVNAYAAFATGDYFSAVKSLSGFVGGLRGKPDPAAQAQMAMMRQLQEVIRLQKETLIKLAELSKQLSVSTEAILARIDINIQVSSLAVKSGENVDWKNVMLDCWYFYDTAGSNNRLTPGGSFISYKARYDHFKARVGEGKPFNSCEAIFQRVGKLLRRLDGDNSHVHMGLWDYGVEAAAGAPESPWKYQSDWYEPMLELNKAALSLSGASSLCTQRAVAQLAATPASLFEAYALLQPCDTTALASLTPRERPGLFSYAINGHVSFEGAFTHVVHPARVSQIGQLMLFAQPFQELRPVKGNIKQAILYEATALPKATVSGSVLEEQQTAYRDYSEVVSVTLAQQSALAGVLAVPYAVDILKRSNYGFSNTDALARRQPWRDALAPLAPAGTGALWTYPVGAGFQSARPHPQEFAVAAHPTVEQAKAIVALRELFREKYLGVKPELDGSKPERDGYCPSAAALASTDVAVQAAAIICLMDWHPAFARNVALGLFTDSVRRGNFDLTLVDRWMAQDSDIVMASAMPGLPLVRTGAAGQAPLWGLRLLHPDGRELFMASPSVPEMEQSGLSYPRIAYPLMQLRDTLLDRAGALSPNFKDKDGKEVDAKLLPIVGDKSQEAILLRTVWTRQKGQFEVPAGVDSEKAATTAR